MIQSRPYVKTSEDKYFKNLDMVVSDWWVLSGGQEVDLTTVAR
jgi:hypothetical protein